MRPKLPSSTPPRAGQFEASFGVMGPPTMFTVPMLRYMKTFRITEEQVAMVAIVQREWAAKNPRATTFKEPITVAEVRAKDILQEPAYILGTGESVEGRTISQMDDFASSRAFRVSGEKGFDEGGIKHKDVDHLMICDAFAHLPCMDESA